MLLGEFRCKADDEGRVEIPAAFRPQLAEGATATRGVDRCIVIYPAQEWKKLTDDINMRLRLTSRPARRFARFIFSGAADALSREENDLLLPDELREYAGIENEVTIVGLLTHLEIWHPGVWQEAKESFCDDGPDLADSLREYAI